MGEAGYTLFQRCVVEQGLGGIAADIGVCSSLKSALTFRTSSSGVFEERN